MPTTYIKLAIAVAFAAVCTGIYFYISYLQTRVANLQEVVQKTAAERDAAKQQVLAVTEAKDEVVARQQAAEQQAAKLRADLARARGRIQTVPIPSKCDDALNWLAEELK